MMSSIAAKPGVGAPTHTARTLLLTTLALFALAWLGSETARATFPGDNGKIAFNRDGSIWVMNPDGSHQARLTCEPDWDAEQERWPARFLSWSPDGQRIGFEQNDGWRAFVTAAIDADGTGYTPLPGSHGPVWSPDGRRLAFVDRYFDDLELGASNADGSGAARLVSDGSQPTWSPDGQRLAFLLYRDIWAMNRDGSEQTKLTDNLPPFVAGAPDWSPDGQLIAFQRSPIPVNGGDEIWVMNADGSGQTLLTTEGGPPTWSPDGRRIAFWIPGDRESSSEIGVMSADGTGHTRLAIGERPVWSPDASQIAFTRDGDVRVMNADGSELTNLTAGRGGAYPDWQRRPSPPDADPTPRSFCLGKLRHNRDRGIARLAVNVPHPGRVVLQRRPGVKRFARTHEAAGQGRILLRVRPRGRAQRKLARAGRAERRVTVPVRARVTFRPQGGEPLTKGRRVQLVRAGRR